MEILHKFTKHTKYHLRIGVTRIGNTLELDNRNQLTAGVTSHRNSL